MMMRTGESESEENDEPVVKLFYGRVCVIQGKKGRFLSSGLWEWNTTDHFSQTAQILPLTCSLSHILTSPVLLKFAASWAVKSASQKERESEVVKREEDE